MGLSDISMRLSTSLKAAPTINPSDIMKFQWKFFRNARNQNPLLLGEKQECYLSAMQLSLARFSLLQWWRPEHVWKGCRLRWQLFKVPVKKESYLFLSFIITYTTKFILLLRRHAIYLATRPDTTLPFDYSYISCLPFDYGRIGYEWTGMCSFKTQMKFIWRCSEKSWQCPNFILLKLKH